MKAGREKESTVWVAGATGLEKSMGDERAESTRSASRLCGVAARSGIVGGTEVWSVSTLVTELVMRRRS